ncbi:shikimate kinase [Parablastomonas sp. CN1-191]|uniref:shikimate kinase n=1 Tax=Parablastomonas sp. CN1-191 TaxID=3400908 RepID=UPI003BF80230
MDHDAPRAAPAANAPPFAAGGSAAADLARARRVSQPIVLVGMMGAGKTTVGRKLAATLERRFVDADEAIVAAAQMSIADMFERYGEAYFRDGERRVIARLMADASRGAAPVIATGGGAFADAETRALILDKAIAVWLDADLATLVERVGRRSTRPLLQGKDPAAVLAALLEAREVAYAQAPIRVTSGRGPHARTVDAIVAELAAWR